MTRSPTGEARIVRARPTVERLDSALDDLTTGEHDIGTGEFGLSLEEAAGTAEVEPIVPVIVPRKREIGEHRASLVLALLIAAAVFSFFAPALWDVTLKPLGRRGTSWRVVTVEVSSEPAGATVVINGQAYGETPLTARLPCRRKPVNVSVSKVGYQTWGYKTLCPDNGDLSLKARLRK